MSYLYLTFPSLPPCTFHPHPSPPFLTLDSPLNPFDETEEDAATLEGGEEQAQALSTSPSATATTDATTTTATPAATSEEQTQEQQISVQEG